MAGDKIRKRLGERLPRTRIAQATKPSDELLAHGVPGIHYYLMQTAKHVQRVIEPELKSASA